MFESTRSGDAVTMPSAAELAAFLERLGAEAPATSDAERIDQIRALEAVKSGAAAAQARVTVEFNASQRAEQAAQGLPAKEQGRGVASQIALARRDSPVKGSRHLGLAKALVQQMPHTLAALAAGEISEWRATIMARETAVLDATHRSEVDAALTGRLGALGDRGVEREAKKLAYRLDPGSVLRRTRGAITHRRVSIRPAPDTMAYLTGFLPVAQGVAAHASLSRHADAAKAAGDSRTRGQIMADTLVERLTGQARADAVSVEVNLIMTDSALFTGDDTPARLEGYGPVPAALGRSLVTGSGSMADTAQVWVRRLFNRPDTGELVAMESRRRRFEGMLRRFLVIRDEVCRTPWCDAPVRHGDHVVPVARGGTTSAENGQGLCETCNQAKEAPGWSASASRAGPAPEISVVTPTGHVYASNAPPLPGSARLRASPLEEKFATLIAAA
jgi:hypothetical protein